MPRIPEGWKRDAEASCGITAYNHKDGNGRISKLTDSRSYLKWSVRLSTGRWVRFHTLRDAAATYEQEIR